MATDGAGSGSLGGQAASGATAAQDRGADCADGYGEPIRYTDPFY